MITFSFSPSSRSILPSIAASVSTFVVSWKDAAERNDSVASDAFVMPRISGSDVACSFFSFFDARVLALEHDLVDELARQEVVSPALSTRTFFSIWRTISSMCLSWISTPCDL